MHYQPSLCLHVPVPVTAHGRKLQGELYLPRDAKTLRLCILQRESAILCSRLGSLLANPHTATLTLCADGAISVDELMVVVEWVRSRRLLQSLAVKIVAPQSVSRYLHRTHGRGARRTQRRVLGIAAQRQIFPASLAFAAVGRV
jgi:hypothetical protein